MPDLSESSGENCCRTTSQRPSGKLCHGNILIYAAPSPVVRGVASFHGKRRRRRFGPARAGGELDFPRATQVAHHCGVIGIDLRGDRGCESRRAKRARESAASVCTAPMPVAGAHRDGPWSCTRRAPRGRNAYTGEYERRRQTATAVNIVLLKNRTLVSVSERVVPGGGLEGLTFLAIPLFVHVSQAGARRASAFKGRFNEGPGTPFCFRFIRPYAWTRDDKR